MPNLGKQVKKIFLGREQKMLKVFDLRGDNRARRIFAIEGLLGMKDK
jgi:hypothetical protein